VADFNGDGKRDILEQGTGTLLALLGSGDGTFQPPKSTASGANLSVVAAADLNGDGKADVAGVFNSSLMVYLGKGDGTSPPEVSYAMGSPSAAMPVLSFGDFYSDGKTDISVSIAGDVVVGQEIIFLGNGDGSFQAAKAFAAVFYAAFAVVGGLNRDRKLDLAISSPGFCNGTCSVQPSVFVLLGTGDGTFQAPTAAFTVNGPTGTKGTLASADVNGDGNADLLVDDAAGVRVYLGNGDGTFSNAANYFASLLNVGPGSIAIADFNLDGKPDVATNNAVLLGK
jgi:hypothetical protein